MPFQKSSTFCCNQCNYLGFEKDLIGCYMAFINYIVVLAFTRKMLSLQFSSDWYHERGLLRLQFPIKINPHHQKAKNNFIVAQNSLSVLKLLRALNDGVVFRFHKLCSIIWSSTKWLKFRTRVHCCMFTTILMFIFGKFDHSYNFG